MPIHTIEIIHDVNTDLSEEELVRYFSSFGFSEDNIRHFLTPSYSGKHEIKLDLFDEFSLLGLKEITIIKMLQENYFKPLYYIVLSLNPLLDKTGPEYLYYPSKENNDNLVNKFRDIMLKHFNCDAEFSDLRTWRAREVHYTKDFIFENKEQAELFIKLSHKTSKYVRRKHLDKKGLKKYEQSAAEHNKSSKVSVYDKPKEIQENREGYSENTIKFMANRVANRARFEIQCYKLKIGSIAKTNNFGRCIMNFLNEDLAREILRKSYEQTVGIGNFYTAYHAKKVIDNSDLRSDTKEKIFNLLRLMAQARSLDQGREQFVEGGHTIKHTDIVVEGSAVTFNNYLNTLKELNINPVLIPKDWSRDYGITFLHNPCDEL